MIQLRDITLMYGERALFDSISAAIGSDERVGLVGRNGAGKSTLLKLVAGLLQPHEGTVALERDKKIGYMPQEVVLLSDKPVFDEAMTVFDHYLTLEHLKSSLEAQLAQGPSNAEELLEQYSVVSHDLEQFDKAAALARTERILRGLGFSDELMQMPVTNLSVGWRMRLVLAQLLLQDADFYLFDEPTNHLDIVTKEWFFDFLKNARFGFLLVTHDRYYLEHVCDSMLELERGNATRFMGNFSAYIAQKEQQRAVALSTRERQEKEMSRKQATINRFRASASKAKMAQSMIKQLDKMELIDVEPPLPTIKLTFPPVVRAGDTVLTVNGIEYHFGPKQLFTGINAHIMRGEKVALVAANGMGKTTLFNLIAGTYELQQGSVKFGHKVDYAVFEQDQLRALTPTNTILQEVINACPPDVSEATVRAFLGSFLFSGDDIYKTIDKLSGGERNRVAMVKVLLQKANLLLLDEPTNHLDIYAKDILLQALKAYSGTVLMVSHDHDFLQQLATRVLELTPRELITYPGTYESYCAQKKEQQAVTESATTVKKPKTEAALDSRSVRKENLQLESRIAKLERDVTQLNQRFLSVTYGSMEYNQTAKKLKDVQQQLEAAMARWEALQPLL